MYKAIKRLFDLVSSFVAIVITFPIWTAIAVGIKLSSPGPVLYKSIRSGKDHKQFPMYKFRSMHVYDPNKYASEYKGKSSFIANEDRIFKLGKFLRNSKLDELPQLLNVFVGQMSVVGPRPYPEVTVKKYYTGDYEKIMSTKPGLSCLDSLFDYAHGEIFVKNEKEYAENVLPVRSELAKLYVEKKNVGLDLYCIIRTIQLMFEIVVLKKKSFDLTKYEMEAVENVKKQKAANS